MIQADSNSLPACRPGRIGLAAKLAYSAFVAFHLWYNLHFYGPLNYLWFCDIAMVATAVGLWLESRLVLSMVALAILGPSGLWCLDLIWRGMTGHYLLGMAAYMSDPAIPYAVRLASTFHLWLPPLLFWYLWKLGYERRALLYQTLFAVALLIVCRIISDPPGSHADAEEVNINFVYGHSELPLKDQLPAWIYITRMVLKYWFCMYLPLHVVLLTTFGKRKSIPSEKPLRNNLQTNQLRAV